MMKSCKHALSRSQHLKKNQKIRIITKEFIAKVKTLKFSRDRQDLRLWNKAIRTTTRWSSSQVKCEKTLETEKATIERADLPMDRHLPNAMNSHDFNSSRLSGSSQTSSANVHSNSNSTIRWVELISTASSECLLKDKVLRLTATQCIECSQTFSPALTFHSCLEHLCVANNLVSSRKIRFSEEATTKLCLIHSVSCLVLASTKTCLQTTLLLNLGHQVVQGQVQMEVSVHLTHLMIYFAMFKKWASKEPSNNRRSLQTER